MNCGREEMRKGLWSPEEDEKLFNYIIRYGIGRWSSLPQKADLQRCGKSCRLRWLNYLRPDVKRGSFSQKEEDLIITLHRNLGNRWSQIAGKLPGRTDNEIKNFWNSNLKKKLKNQAGIDPNTHRSVSTETQLEPLQEYMFSSIASSGPITVPVFDLSSPHLDCKNFISEPIQTIENSATALPNSNIVLDVWNSFYTEYYSNDSERNYHENSWIDFLQHDMEDTLMDPHAVSFPPGFDCRIDEDGFDTITSS